MGKHHVVPHRDGWAVKAEGKTRATAVFGKQDEAIAAAKKIASNQGGFVLVHRPDGTIRTERVERITGTIKVDVESGEGLTVVERKIARAEKRLTALSAKVALKRKTRERKLSKTDGASGAGTAKKPTTKKAAAKKTAAKKSAAKKPTVRKAATSKAKPKKPAGKSTVAKKPVARKTAAKKPSVKKTAAKKAPTGKKAASRRPAPKKAPAGKSTAKKPAERKLTLKSMLSRVAAPGKAARKTATGKTRPAKKRVNYAIV